MEVRECGNHVPERDRLCVFPFDFSTGTGDPLRGMVEREGVVDLVTLLFDEAEAAALFLVDGIVKLMDTKRLRDVIK